MVNLTEEITMNVLLTALITFVSGLGLTILVPLIPVGLAFLSFTGAFLIWFLPTAFSSPYSLFEPIGKNF